MVAIEDTYFSMASKWSAGQNVLVICDRGTMDAAAYVEPGQWPQILDRLGLDELNINEGRYDHVVHMVKISLKNFIILFYVL